VWAQKHLGYRLKITQSVPTAGPYALLRNPIYIGNTLVILGAVVMSEVLWMVPWPSSDVASPIPSWYGMRSNFCR
jgi:protein-S-isoprenylcysteine O-methyltransferase Ste14